LVRPHLEQPGGAGISARAAAITIAVAAMMRASAPGRRPVIIVVLLAVTGTRRPAAVMLMLTHAIIIIICDRETKRHIWPGCGRGDGGRGGETAPEKEKNEGSGRHSGFL
jgi:hypothetical protein